MKKKINFEKIVMELLHGYMEIQDFTPEHCRGDWGCQAEDRIENTENITNEMLDKYGKYIKCSNCGFDLWYENGGCWYDGKQYCGKCYTDILNSNRQEQ